MAFVRTSPGINFVLFSAACFWFRCSMPHILFLQFCFEGEQGPEHGTSRDCHHVRFSFFFFFSVRKGPHVHQPTCALCSFFPLFLFSDFFFRSMALFFFFFFKFFSFTYQFSVWRRAETGTSRVPVLQEPSRSPSSSARRSERSPSPSCSWCAWAMA